MNSELLLERAGTLARRLPESALRRWLTIVPAMVALWLLAGLVWLLLTPTPGPSPWQPQQDNASGTDLDLSGLNGYPMFGVADVGAEQAQPAQQLVDAPETRLKLRLTGLVAESHTGSGVAIIESQGSQMAYRVGDDIKGTRAKVARILWDRVLLDNSGKTEALMVDGKEYQPLSVLAAPAGRKPAPTATVPAAEVKATLRQVRDNPQSIGDLVRFSPAREGDNITGYRVAPGRDPAMFKQLGLESGDLVKSINGYDLSDPAQALDILGQLQGLDSLSLDIERGGQPMSLNINIAQ
ncbi:type II secretion system protein GspC [Gallaecimonas pentaromativorans]|nr:type II secretion system protein GspC [Gallaecimonas pentaromativorans]